MQNLQRIRVWRKLSLTDLSAVSGVPMPTIRQHEGGKSRSTDVVTAWKLATALNVPMEVLWIDLPWDFDVKANAIKGGRKPKGYIAPSKR